VRSYLRAQPAKYVPGGWAQPVSQVAHTANLGAHVGRATVAYPVQAVCLMVAGATLGSGLGFSEEPSSTLRWVSLAGLLSLVLLSRRWMMAVFALVGRAFRRGGWGALVPPQEASLKCFAWSLCVIGFMAAAFSLLAAGSYSGSVPPLTMISVFSLAWVAGFVAIPVPAGVGVREAVLMSVLGSAGPASVAVALSVAHRGLQMVAELVLAAGSGFRPRSSRSGARSVGDD